MSPEYVESQIHLTVGFIAILSVLYVIYVVKTQEAEDEIGERVNPMDGDIEFDPKTGKYVTAYVWDGTRYYVTSKKRERLQKVLARIEKRRKKRYAS